MSTRAALVERPCSQPSVRRQCELLGVSRRAVYYEPRGESPENLELMRLIDQVHMDEPTYGSPRMTAVLQRAGWLVNEKRVARLMRLMGIEAIYQKPRTSKPEPGHKIYPYLLGDREIRAPDEVWCADITYVPMPCGFMCLVAVMDWHSRYVLSWELSNTLETEFCLTALEVALSGGRRPQVFNTDQGCQFTSAAFTGSLLGAGIEVSMDGRGRFMDNIFIERLWRSYKYEEIYIRAHATPCELHDGSQRWFERYNTYRPHQSLDYATPHAVYTGSVAPGSRPAPTGTFSTADHYSS